MFDLSKAPQYRRIRKNRQPCRAILFKGMANFSSYRLGPLHGSSDCAFSRADHYRPG